MLIRQSKHSFIRTTKRYGYITNQLTRHDRSYDEFGAILLKEISREPRDVDDIVNHLLTIFEDVDRDTLKADFMEFAESLARDKFIVLGETLGELDAKDDDFTYDIDNPKTLVDNFYQVTDEKVSENTQDFFLEEVQGRPLISSLQFELSSRCNERCIHCYIPNEKKNKGFDMPTAKVKSILDEFADMGGIHVTLSGGEAFLHKDLIEIARYCRKKDLKISILSNLISLKDEQIPALKEVNLSLIQVSLYSMDPEIHDFITTVKGSFEKTKAAIEKLVAADIPVLFLTMGGHMEYHTPDDVPSTLNYDGMQQTLEFSEQLITQLANMPTTPDYISVPSTQKMSHAKFKVTLGLMPDVMGASSTPGLRADIVVAGKPAHNAGIRSGDIIQEIDGKAVNDINEYMERLAELKAGTTIPVKVLRGEEIIVFEVHLTPPVK